MSNIVLRVRNYPWQWSEDFAKAYTLEELKDPVKLKYTGGSLIEIHQEFYINAIKKQVKDFFYPLAKNVRNDPFNYALYSYTYTLPKNHKGEYLEVKGSDTLPELQLGLENTLTSGEENKKLLELYLSYFDELANYDREKRRSDKVFETLLLLLGNGEERPRYSFIASISDELLKLLPSLCRSMRKILSGKRMMLPLSRVKELDQSCIRFLIKQPGDTLKQKVAANDFKMMGIARVEKYDLLENRVLKDFLYRAQRECEKYLSEFSHDSKVYNSERVKKVILLERQIAIILKNPVWNEITRQNTLPGPNYVLQNEKRYKVIWKYYLTLIRQERQLDLSFKYQDNTFCDLTGLLLQSAFCSLVSSDRLKSKGLKLDCMGDSYIEIYKEQHFGKKLSSYPVGPFILSTKDNCYYEIQLWSHAFKHEAQYPKNAVLKYLGTQRFIKIISMDGDNKNSNNFIIPVYSVNVVQSKQSDSIEDIFKNATLEISKANSEKTKGKYHIGALIFANIKNGIEFKKTENGIGMYCISSNPNDWGLNAIGIVDFLADYIGNIL